MTLSVLLFYLNQIHVVKDTHLFLSVKRNKMYGLWDTPLTAPVLSPSNIESFQSANSIIHLKKILDGPTLTQLQFYDK